MEYMVTRYVMPPRVDREEREAAWKEAEDLVEMKIYIKRNCTPDGRRVVYYLSVERLEEYNPPIVA